MNRRLLMLGVVSAVAALSSPAQTQQVPAERSPLWVEWKEIPSVVVMSTEDDSRRRALHEAVDVWNTEFAMLGSPFRLGAIMHSLRAISADDLRAWKARSRTNPVPPTLIASVSEANGDVIVAMSDGDDFDSFASPFPSLRKALIAIRSLQKYPFLLGIERNVIAHELGHAIGLGHNDDEATLMCGGARCWHWAFPKEGFLPLTSAEKAKLREMYPPSREPKPSRRWRGDPPVRIPG